jgi:hypothetical protein
MSRETCGGGVRGRAHFGKLVPAGRDRAEELDAARVERVDLLALRGGEGGLSFALGRDGLQEDEDLHEDVPTEVTVAQPARRGMRRDERRQARRRHGLSAAGGGAGSTV